MDWITVINDDATTCPPFGAVEPKSIDPSTGLVKVGKPTAANRPVFFNGGTPIRPGGKGQASISLPALAAYQADNATGEDPAHGDIWGTEAGSWYLHRTRNRGCSGQGFQIIGGGGSGLCNVVAQSAGDQIAVATQWNWTSIFESDGTYGAHYQMSPGEAAQCEVGLDDVYVDLPQLPCDHGRALLAANFGSTGHVVKVFTNDGALINGLDGSATGWYIPDTGGGGFACEFVFNDNQGTWRSKTPLHY